MAENRPSIEMLGRSSTFVHDLGLSAAALVAAPLLVLLTAIIGAALPAFGRQNVFGLVIQLVLAGFVGVQRIWFLRVWRNSHLELHELAPLTWRFLGRYVELGFTLAVAFIPVLVFDLAFLRSHPAAIVAIGVVYALAADMALTFVTPALTYTTRSVRDALDIGFGMLRSSWPRSAWYILTPGLVLLSAAYLLPFRAGGIALAAVTAVIGLWFKGAVAAFYLRVHPEIDGFGA